MNAELRSISTEVIYSIFIFIIIVSFIQWLTKGFYGNNMIPPEHIPTTLIFTASSPAIYRIAKHIIKNRKNFKHLVGEENRGQSSKLLRDKEATTESVVSDLTAEISNTPPTLVTSEATVAQISGEKVTENPKHPMAEKEIRNEDGGNIKEEDIQNKEVGAGEKADDVDIVVTGEDLESLKSLKERLILLRRNWGLMS